MLDRLRAAEVKAQLVFLTESIGTPADELALGNSAHSWPWYRSDEGLDSLVGRVDGISVAKADLLSFDARGRRTGATDLVAGALEVGANVLTPLRDDVDPVIGGSIARCLLCRIRKTNQPGDARAA